MGRRFDPDGAYVEPLAEVHRSGDYLTHEKIWISFRKEPSIDYRHAAHIFASTRWRGVDWRDIRERQPRGVVLVIGHDDTLITRKTISSILDCHSYRAIFASNLSEDARSMKNVFDLPLGIPNDEKHSKTHIVQADQTLIRAAWKSTQRLGRPAIPEVYGNFSVRTNPSAREPVLQVLSSMPRARQGKFVLSKRGRLRDLKLMAKAGLVVCPRGNGLDTHRFWETLLVGAIPIVLSNDHSASMARSLALPHIALEEWGELKDTKVIESEWEKIEGTRWDFSPLTSTYWMEKIRKSAAVA